MAESGQPAGWYPSPDPSRSKDFARYWDGAAWTNHETPIHAHPPEEASTPSDKDPGPAPHVTFDVHADADADAMRAEPPVTRLTWLPKVVIAAVILAIGATLVLERSDAVGPVGYSLQDRTTDDNPLSITPRLIVSNGGQPVRIQTRARFDDALTRLPGFDWSLDAPLTIELVSGVPGDLGHVTSIDLRDAGANWLSDGWFVRIDVTATDRAFEIQVSQPITRGITRTRVVVHEATIPRTRLLRTAAPEVSDSDAASEQESAAPVPTPAPAPSPAPPPAPPRTPAPAPAPAPAPQQANALDPNGEPRARTLTLEQGFMDDPRLISVRAGGTADTSSLPLQCRDAAIDPRPDVRLNYRAGSIFPLNIYAYSQTADLFLVVQLPNGRFTCNDDYSGLDPAVLIDSPQSGTYNIWVGVFGEGVGTGMLAISEFSPRFP